MDLSDFIDIETQRIQLFKAWYTKQHENNPEHFPLSIPADNSGVWWEMLTDFDPESPAYKV